MLYKLFYDCISTILAGDYVWIGANDKLTEGTYVWVETNKQATEITNDWWAQGFPQDTDGNNDCVYLRNKTLVNENCNNSRPFMCMEPSK